MEKLDSNVYSSNIRLVSQKIHRSGIVVYVSVVPLIKLIEIMPEIDPSKRADTNRFVDEKHARNFADYWIHRQGNWIIPGIIVSYSGSPDYIRSSSITNTDNEVGIITLPKIFNKTSRILDGQHRILGFRYALEKIESSLHKKKQELEGLRLSLIKEPRNEVLSIQIVNTNIKISELETSLQRLYDESVTIEIYTGMTDLMQENFFVDIATNARKISKDAVVKFSDDPISNITRKIIKYNILLSKISNTYDTKEKKSTNEIFTLSDVKEIVTSLLFSIDKSSYIPEESIDENSTIKVIESFFASLQNLPEYTYISTKNNKDEILNYVKATKNNSIVYSKTLIRCLAHSYGKNVITSKRLKHDKIDKFIFSVDNDAELNYIRYLKCFDFSINKGSLATFWYDSDIVKIDSKSFGSRTQDLKKLATTFEYLLRGNQFATPGKILKIENNKPVVIKI